MILILGGTTEGRVAVRVADEAAATYYYSTKGTLQSIECAHGIRLTGAMNAEEMECFCRDHAIKLLIDAAHPFAQVLHQTIEKVSKCLQIPVIRYERRYPPRDEDLIWCDSYADAIHQMENKGIQRLLALIGDRIPLGSVYWSGRNLCRWPRSRASPKNVWFSIEKVRMS